MSKDCSSNLSVKGIEKQNKKQQVVNDRRGAAGEESGGAQRTSERAALHHLKGSEVSIAS
jgi:hypothetical protein